MIGTYPEEVVNTYSRVLFWHSLGEKKTAKKSARYAASNLGTRPV
jgi:hypothetical protein